MFQCLPADFQQQALLRVHADRFAASDGKKRRIKKIDVGQKTAEFICNAPWSIGVWIVICGRVPALRRSFGNGVAPAG